MAMADGLERFVSLKTASPALILARAFAILILISSNPSL